MLLLIVFLGFSLASPLVVQTESGLVQGRFDAGQLARVWLGIPYADKPYPRLLPPALPKSWDGTRNATQFGSACQQFGSLVPVSEDCLFVNVFAPAVEQTELLPVMVWIHGGGFQIGYSNNYNCSFLVQERIICVTLNYRLGMNCVKDIAISMALFV
jgi:para-nitrobenzyl esterase